MKRKPVIPYLLAAAFFTAGTRVGAQPGDAAVALKQAGGDVSIEQARAEYRTAEDKIARLKADDQSTSDNKDCGAADQPSVREKLRPAVVESFLARQRLQQAELAQLRRRLAEIEQSLAEREERMDAIVDSRVDELLSPRRERAAQERYDSAVEVLKRLERLHAVGKVDEAAITTHQIDLHQAKAQLDRARAKADELAGQRAEEERKPRACESASPGHGQSNAIDQFDIETREHLAKLDVQAAEVDVEVTEKDLSRASAAYETGTLSAEQFRSYEKDNRHAEIELQRAKAKLEGLARQRFELEAAADAAVEQAEAEGQKAAALVREAEAAGETALAQVEKSKSDVEAAESTLAYRQKQYDRMKSLAAEKAVDEKLVHESENHLDAAKASLAATKASVITAQAAVDERASAIEGAQAELSRAKARLRAATAARDRLKNSSKKPNPFEAKVEETPSKTPEGR